MKLVHTHPAKRVQRSILSFSQGSREFVVLGSTRPFFVVQVYRDVVKTGGFPRRSFLCCAMSGRGEYYKQKYGGGRGGGRRGGRSGGEGGGRRGGRNSQGTSWSESDSRGNHSNDAAEPGKKTVFVKCAWQSDLRTSWQIATSPLYAM